MYKPVYVCHSSVSLVEFYYHLACSLGIEPLSRKAKMFKAIKDGILQLNNSSRIHSVLFIDEAHLLRTEFLAELRLLLNFEIDSKHAATVILCGQEQLAYIEKRISDSGNSALIFSKNAYTFIHQASGGNFRIIGNIASAALIKAFSLQSSMVEADHPKILQDIMLTLLSNYYLIHQVFLPVYELPGLQEQFQQIIWIPDLFQYMQ